MAEGCASTQRTIILRLALDVLLGLVSKLAIYTASFGISFQLPFFSILKGEFKCESSFIDF
jgi:hypothetical protein